LTVTVGILGLIVLFLLLAVLGALREVAILRGEIAAWSQLVKRPPPPSYVGRQIPHLLREEVNLNLPNDESVASPLRAVAFVSPTCTPCVRLMAGLQTAIERGTLNPARLLYVTWASTVEASEQLASRLPAPAVVDRGDLGRACEVRGTPTIILLNFLEGKVIDVHMEGDPEWVIHQLHPTERQRPVAQAA